MKTRCFGIDASTNGTAICCYDLQDKDYFIYTFSRKHVKKPFHFEHKNFVVHVEPMPKEFHKEHNEDDFLRYRAIAKHIWDFVVDDIGLVENSLFFIENYAYGQASNLVPLMEFTALLKNHIYEAGYKLDGVFSPTAIKKEIGGHGALKKADIYKNKWNDRNMIDLFEEIELYDKYAQGCWHEDVLDSYAICEYALKTWNVEK